MRVHDIFDEGGLLALLHGEVGGEGLGAVQLGHGQVHPGVLGDAEPRGAAVLLPRPLPRPLQPPLPAPGLQIPAAVLAPPVLRAAGLGVCSRVGGDNTALGTVLSSSTLAHVIKTMKDSII